MADTTVSAFVVLNKMEFVTAGKRIEDAAFLVDSLGERTCRQQKQAEGSKTDKQLHNFNPRSEQNVSRRNAVDRRSGHLKEPNHHMAQQPSLSHFWEPR